MSTTEDTTAATAVKAEATTPATEVVAPKMEETAAAAASTATPVVATEALAAAAAAAVNAVEVPPPDTVAAAAPGRVSLLNDVDGQGKRRFFPRVKHLIGNKEWEDVSEIETVVVLVVDDVDVLVVVCQLLDVYGSLTHSFTH